jgi:hypothetical protein
MIDSSFFFIETYSHDHNKFSFKNDLFILFNIFLLKHDHNTFSLINMFFS